MVLWVLATFATWGAALGWSVARAGMGTASDVLTERLDKAEVTPSAGLAMEPTLESAPKLAPEPAPEPAGNVVRVGRRRFLVQLGGATAAITLVGAGLGAVLRTSEQQPVPTGGQPTVPLPNADSSIEPVPGTRAEYTPVEDHYRIDINATPPNVDGTSWRLKIFGLVASPLTLSIDQIVADYEPVDQFVTLACVSNPLGGPLIGTTRWTGARLQDVLADVGVQENAKYARTYAVDGFHETLALDLVRSEPRIMLAYNWNDAPLPRVHGYPLRIYIPDHYGMKQPRWIEEIELVDEYVDGYWVTRGWDREATMKVTSVIDVVAVDGIIERDGGRFVPVGGIAHAGARSISRVEVQVDDGEWQEATLRPPLSDTTWVIWRYEWPFQPGEHVFRVRCNDGGGAPQITERQGTFPSGATGIDSLSAEL
ncbi:MAG: molybdopterin-dependent oxidoreductase [Actinobacteria bacterium]|nr:molybdopterin-dependent oxidoreductase [Actinomycetota bacterium]